MASDTIFATSTGGGLAAIAIVRMSGAGVQDTLRALAGRCPIPRRATLMRLRDPIRAEPIDQALVLYFPAPRSFTGEDCAEFHIHGGRAVETALLDCLRQCPDHRPAEPGEFTRRAFEAGRLDLAQVEGLSDLITAETGAQRKQALAQLDGALHREIDSWADQLKRSLAYFEAGLDFVDEDDVADRAFEAAMEVISALGKDLEHALKTSRPAERIRDGVRVALVGAPNAGKSSLLNYLTRRDVAIVHETAGTTRDSVEVRLDLAGVPVRLIDTAGLRTSDDAVERLGMDRTHAAMQSAALVVWLTDLSDVAEDGMKWRLDASREAEIWRIGTKSDLVGKDGLLRGRARVGKDGCVSTVSGDGIAEFEKKLLSFARECTVGGESAVFTRARHRAVLEGVLQELQDFHSCAADHAELGAEHLRRAMGQLGRLTGKTDVEDLLDLIFRDFCIGK